MTPHAGRQTFVRAGIVFGLGIGGFFDGIVLHQILQWHHLLSDAGYPPTTLENLQINTLADGLFHAVTWALTLIGLFLFWRAYQRGQTVRSVSTLLGSILIGWGLFNLVEGLIDHHLLQIHHVRSGPDQALWDIGFLIWGALMLGIGFALARREAA